MEARAAEAAGAMATPARNTRMETPFNPDAQGANFRLTQVPNV
jgi:hypothetical protein